LNDPHPPAFSCAHALGVASLLFVGCVAMTGCGDGEVPAADGGGAAAPGAGGDGGGATGPGTTTGSGGGIGSGAGGGEGGAGVACTPEGTFGGEPIEGEAGQWTWVGVPDALCRDGSPTGFGVRLNPASDKLFIYLEGGGACFSTLTCTLNPSSYGELAFMGWASGGKGGLFDTENQDNPVRDWNGIYIPYCTGDVHAGNATDIDVPGIGAPAGQSFVGYRNIGLYLDRIIPTFPSVTQVLLTGSSAGGVGAAYNYDRVAQAFCPRPVVLVDDAGPPMSDEYLAPCLQKRWRELWGLDGTLPVGCPDCSGADGGGIVNYATYLADRYPDARLGLVSSEEDDVIRLFYGFGENDCGNLDGVLPSSMSGPRFREGLANLRDSYLSKSPVWGTYFVPGAAHTFLGGGGYTATKVEDVPLTEWISTMIDGGDPGHLGL
jgi:hypothetical protein